MPDRHYESTRRDKCFLTGLLISLIIWGTVFGTLAGLVTNTETTSLPVEITNHTDWWVQWLPLA